MTVRFLFVIVVLLIGTMSPASAKPNILLLLTDDQRPDTIAALGNQHIHTPNLDALVRHGTTFTRATCAYPICVMSRAELLTGTTVFRAGVPYRGRVIDPELATWAKTFRDAGYHTWFVGKWHNDGRPKQRGYEETRGLFTGGGAPPELRKPKFDAKGREITGYRGWTFKTDDGQVELDKGVGLTPDISEHFAEAAIELIVRKPSKPFFLQVSFTAPHDPRLMPTGYDEMYDPAKIPLPKNFRADHPFDHGNRGGRDENLLPIPRAPDEVRAEIATYYAILTHLDKQIGRIIEVLQETDQLKNTIIIFTSDHGLALGSHGLLGKQNMYEHTINVPLIWRGPGIPKNRQRDAQCYLRDLFPTCCELAEMAIPETVRGKSLVPVLRGEKSSVYPFIVGYFTDTQRMIRDERWKLIHYPKVERIQLFDLKKDPHELHNLANQPTQKNRVLSLMKTMKGWLIERGDPVYQH